MKRKYADCYYCGGTVMEKMIEWDYRRGGKHLIFRNVPAGVCSQCGEKFFRPEVSKKMDRAFHRTVPTLHIKIPVIAFKAA
jgi:YgiT-type zinc finger domain-containing protein